VFSAPVALPGLAQLLESPGCLERRDGFISGHARRFYRITPPQRPVRLVATPWQVPERYETGTPFLAGQTLRRQVENGHNSPLFVDQRR
jgi:dihydroorotase